MSGRLKMVVESGVFPDLIQLNKQVGQTLPQRNATPVVSANKVIVSSGYLPRVTEQPDSVSGQGGSVNAWPDYISK